MKYIVKIYEAYSTEIEIEAIDEDDAKEKANDCLASGYLPDGITEVPKGKYDFTLDSDDWTVWEA